MSFTDFQNRMNEARAASEQKREELKKARQKASNITRRRDALLREVGAETRADDERLAAVRESEAELERQAAAAGKSYSQAIAEELAALHEFLEFTNPIENIASLQDRYPILLLPLRLETRFKKVERDGVQVDQLWVRVFPDEIAINSFESDLSETEVRDARAYWLARWKAGKEVDGQRGAWRSLASAHGPGRAYWLVNNYTPTNLSDEPTKAAGEIILAIGAEEAPEGTERSEIVRYWQDVWHAGTDSDRLNQAWSGLVAAVGEERAGEVVKDLKPANLNDPPPEGFTRDGTVVRVEFVVFEKTDELETKLHA